MCSALLQKQASVLFVDHSLVSIATVLSGPYVLLINQSLGAVGEYNIWERSNSILTSGDPVVV